MSGGKNISVWWNEMSVKKGGEEEEKGIISKEPGVDFKLGEGFKVVTGRGKIEEGLQGEIQKFLAQHDQTASGNTTLMTPRVLGQLAKVECYYSLLRKEDLLIGTMFSFPTQCKIKKTPEDLGELLNSTYTTFLCIAREHRKKALCMSLIRSSLQSGWKDGVYHGYYTVSKPNHPGGIKLVSWTRPLDLGKARAGGFNFPSYRKAGDRDDRRDKLAYKVGGLGEYVLKRVEGNSKEVKKSLENYRGLLKLNKSLRFYWYPEEKEWNKFTEAFDTYQVLDKTGNPTAMFGLALLSLLVKDTQKIVTIAKVLWTLGNPEVLLKALLQAGQQLQADLVYGFLIGSLQEKHLASIKATTVKSENYLEFYNSSVTLGSSECCVPLL